MKIIGIIGTAGRGEDKQRLNMELLMFMHESIQFLIENVIVGDSGASYGVISGGAAVADHMAVLQYLEKKAAKLTLHLPCPFDVEKNAYVEQKKVYDPGSTSNYYHKLFTRMRGVDSLEEISIAINKGAQVTVTNGFLQRNALVAKDAQFMIAATFGDKGKLKDGGTAHTMKIFQTIWQTRGFSYHINLADRKIYSPAIV